MKHIARNMCRSTIRFGLYGLVCSLTLGATAHADSVGRVSVMEVGDVRDAATISRAKAQMRAEQAGEGSSGGATSAGGCSDLSIGNVKTGVGQPVPRNVVVVIEGPVIQENNCR
ncbi:MAG: hypothetical protein H6953_06750 [Chromatiaceae bacterium]|nr:hypothetical protein [Gammaproteobacteria bacterium]MCP5305128.1 hypothetical protein [Chromatiaceae bacterium]MCP5315087.1 hypothetical protein [Chromatiaceae bacterium]